MRPIDKGDCPQVDGVDIAFADYQHARGELVARLGEYCSYCEIHLDSSLHVEHKLPKNVPRYAHKETAWNNFLLACTNCNSTKGSGDIDENDYLWPDMHNTFLAIDYGPGALMSSAPGLTEDEAGKANNLIKLVGLDKLPGDPRTVTDRRWLNRQEAWDIAERERANLLRSDTIELRVSIALNAKLNGFFSVWMTVFAADSDMLLRIIANYPGTSGNCFDKWGKCMASVTR